MIQVEWAMQWDETFTPWWGQWDDDENGDAKSQMLKHSHRHKLHLKLDVSISMVHDYMICLSTCLRWKNNILAVSQFQSISSIQGQVIPLPLHRILAISSAHTFATGIHHLSLHKLTAESLRWQTLGHSCGFPPSTRSNWRSCSWWKPSGSWSTMITISVNRMTHHYQYDWTTLRHRNLMNHVKPSWGRHWAEKSAQLRWIFRRMISSFHVDCIHHLMFIFTF